MPSGLVNPLDLPVVGRLIAEHGLSVWHGARVVANTDPLTPLANYGALGVMVGAFMLGLVYGRPTMERALAEIDRGNERFDALLARFVELEERIADGEEARRLQHEETARERAGLRDLVIRNVKLLEYYERGTGQA